MTLSIRPENDYFVYLLAHIIILVRLYFESSDRTEERCRLTGMESNIPGLSEVEFC